MVVSGMMCEHCTKRVSKALMSVDGVEKVGMDIGEKTATVNADDVSDEQLIEAVSDAGYEVVDISHIDHVA